MLSTSATRYLKKKSTVNGASTCIRLFASKIWGSANEAVADIKDGATIAFGGFGQWGLPEKLQMTLYISFFCTSEF